MSSPRQVRNAVRAPACTRSERTRDARARALVLVLGLLGCALSCRRPGTSSDAGAALGHASLEVDGRARTFLVHRPVPDPGGPLPLLLAFHGRLGDGAGQEKLSHLSAVANRHGFVVVFPDGVERSWADERGISPAARAGVDDVKFVSRLIDHLVATERVDAARVYATGMSNGAVFTHGLGCRLGAKLAGIAPVDGHFPAGPAAPPLAERCPLAHPLAVVLFAGTEDTFMPYAGGELRGGDGGNVLSAEDGFALWGKLQHCAGARRDETLPDADPADGTRVRRSSLEGCDAGASVTLFTVEGGGHTWPSGAQYLGERIIGKTTHDLDAGEALWAIFSGVRP